GCGQIGEHGCAGVIENLRPKGHAQHEIGAVGARLVRAGAAAALLCAEMLLVAVVDQRVQIVGGLEHDVAALAAIAAIGPAELDELLAAKTHRAAAAVTALQVDLGLIEEFHRSSQTKRGADGPLPLALRHSGNGYSAASAGRSAVPLGSIEINVRPPTPLWNCTAPPSSA